MSFNNFPSFRRKEPPPGVSKETYPLTAPLRDHAEALAENSRKSIEYFDKNTESEFRRMFDLNDRGKVLNSNIDWEHITPEEITDVKNFVAFASKRLAAGAVQSEAYHKEMQKGKVERPLSALAPAISVGHDSLHAMMAFARSGGASLIPGYMKIDDKDAIYSYKEPHAVLEECYVIAFSDFDAMEHRIGNITLTQGLTGEPLVQAVMEDWEKDQQKRASGPFGDTAFKKIDPDFLRKNRLPQFEDSVRNLCRNIEQGRQEENFPVHEFQRILAPLLERLRIESAGR